MSGQTWQEGWVVVAEEGGAGKRFVQKKKRQHMGCFVMPVHQCGAGQHVAISRCYCQRASEKPAVHSIHHGGKHKT